MTTTTRERWKNIKAVVWRDSDDRIIMSKSHFEKVYLQVIPRLHESPIKEGSIDSMNKLVVDSTMTQSEVIWSFIETIEKEAEKRMKNKCVEAIDKRIEEMDKNFDRNQPFIAEAHGIHQLISSLK